MSTALTFPAFGSVVRTSATYFASVLSIHVYGVDVLLTSVGSPPIDGRTRNICASADPISSVMYKSAVVTLDPIGVKTTSKSTMSSSEPVGDEPPVPKDSSVKLAPTLKGTLPHVRPGGRRKKRSSMGWTDGSSRRKK